MLVQREIILCKIESVYKTDPIPAGGDAVLVRDASWSQEGLRMIDRPKANGAIDTSRKLWGGSLMTIAFSVELRGSGAAGTPPEIGPALRACGLDETIVASTSVTYAPVSSGFESCTIYYHEDGKRKRLSGCRGNVVFTFASGDVPVAQFTMTGHEGAEGDTALPTPTFDATDPYPLTGGMLFAIGGSTAYEVQQLTVDLGNQVSTPPSINASSGYAEVRITQRDVNGSINPEDELISTKNFRNEFKASTEQEITTGLVGSGAGNYFTLTMPKCAWRDASQGDRDGVRVLELAYGAGITSGDDELSLVFT